MIGRFIARAVGAVVTLAVGVVVLAVVGVPALLLLAVASVIGVAAMFSVSIPALLAGLLLLAAGVAVIALLGSFIAIGVAMLKIALFALLLVWLARKVFGMTLGRAPRHRTVLVGSPVMDVPAPDGHVRDRYDMEAERELDRELGL